MKENLYLVFNRKEWEMHRLAKLGFEFTDEELDKGLKNEKGYLGTRHAVDCYISKPVMAISSQSCTCKIDKESNLTIDKKCYWHGK